ncbi:MAG: hypothetical protein AAFX59_00540 [Pseudomonadota bacterium]
MARAHVTGDLGGHRVLLQPVLGAVDAAFAAVLDVVPVHEGIAPRVPVTLTVTQFTAGQLTGSRVASGEPGGAPGPIGAAVVVANAAVVVVHLQVEPLVDVPIAVVVDFITDLDGDPFFIDVGPLAKILTARRLGVEVVMVVVTLFKGAIAADTHVDRIGQRTHSVALAAVERIDLKREPLVDVPIAVVVHRVADLDGDSFLIDVGQLTDVLAPLPFRVEVIVARQALVYDAGPAHAGWCSAKNDAFDSASVAVERIAGQIEPFVDPTIAVVVDPITDLLGPVMEGWVVFVAVLPETAGAHPIAVIVWVKAV